MIIFKKVFFFIQLQTLLLLFGSVSAQQTVWMQHIRPGGNEYVWDVTSDYNGNVYATGRVKFSSTFGWAPNTQSPPAIGVETDVFLVKYAPDGELIWAKREGGDQPDWGRSIVTDGIGNVYLVGDYTDTAYFGTNQLIAVGSISNRNLFVNKYDSSGNCVWAYSAGNTADHSRAYAIEVDDQDRPYLAGHISGVSTLNGVNFGINGNNQPFVGAMNGDGTVRWMRNFAATYGGEINDLKYSDGYLYLIGSFKGNMNINGTLHVGNSASWRDVFFVKMDTLGNFIWSKSMVGAYTDQGFSIDVDQNGSVYVLGTFANDLIFTSSVTLNSLGTAGSAAIANAQVDGFVAKYNSLGVFQWVRQVGAPHSVALSRLVIDKNCDKVYFTGSFRPSTYLVGYDTLAPLDSTYNSFILSLDYDGNKKWYKTYGGLGYNHTDGIALDPMGNLIQGGHFDQTAYFDTITVVGQSGMDGFIIKMEPPLFPVVNLIDTNFCVNDTLTFSFCQQGDILVNNVFLNNLPVPFITNGFDISTVVSQSGLQDLSFSLSNTFSTDTVFINQLTAQFPIQAQLGSDTILCANAQLVLDPGSFVTYFWNDGSTGQSLLVDSSGIYFVQVEDSNLCVSSDTISIQQSVPLLVNLGNDTIICSGSNLILDAGTFENYLWNDNSTNSILFVNTTGLYMVQVTDTNSCITSDTIQVTVDSCLSITENLQVEFFVYPNPFSDRLIISLNQTLNGTFKIFNLSGGLVFQKFLTISQGSLEIMDINVAPGAYFFEFVADGNDLFRGKIIKQ